MTKILAFTDPHGSMASALKILALADLEQPDLVICAGDFSYFGSRFDGFLTKLRELGQDILYVDGNHETEETSGNLQIWYPYMRNVEYRIVEASAVRIAGLPATGEYWPGEQVDMAAVQTATSLLGTQSKKPLVLLSHYPPTKTAISGTTCVTPDSGGSALVRQIVEALRPSLFFCGHYHQDFGKEDRLGTSRLINPCPDGQLIEI